MFSIPRSVQDPDHPPMPHDAPAGAEADSGSAFERVDESRRDAALARLLGQGQQAGMAEVRQFTRAAADLDLALDLMWAASSADGSYKAVVLIAPQAGGTGMVFVSRPRSLGEVGVHAALIDFACEQTPPSRVAMAQALLPLNQELERAALERGNFETLATLAYMRRRVSMADTGGFIDWPENVQLLDYEESRRPLFIAALEASYEQTLDCPGLYGRRDTEQVLRGHMATGLFESQMWTLVLVDDAPAGVMLLNAIPTADCVELVYLGLGVAHRGKGLARRLMQRAFQLCGPREESFLSLAVDEGNHPARRLYDRLNFRRTTRKLALVRHLKDASPT